MFDLVIKGGYIIDGTGRSGFLGDVAVTDGKIAEVSRTPGSMDGHRTLDASGRVVSPGFIDIHTHMDRMILKHPYAVNYVTQGVTTIVGGNCGGSMGPTYEHLRDEGVYRPGKGPQFETMGAFLDEVERGRLGVNFATFVGQGNVRAMVMGKDDREPTPQDMRLMKEILRGAIEDGAVGVTSGRSYMPGCLAGDDEIVELMGALTPYGVVYSSHIEDQNLGMVASVNSLLEAGEANGIPVQLTHLKVKRDAWGTAPEITLMMEKARRRGIDVTADVYPYTFNGGTAGRMSDPRVAAALADHGLDADHVDMVAFLAELSENGVEIETTGILDEEDVRHFLAHDYSMVGSDGKLPDEPGSLGSHPRNYGTFPRVLGHYSRDCSLFTLEKAVQKMTSLPAERLRIAERGTLRPGCWADVVVFDESRVRDNSTISKPDAVASGIEAVMVNGEIIVESGEAVCDGRPGAVLRYRGLDVS